MQEIETFSIIINPLFNELAGDVFHGVWVQ